MIKGFAALSLNILRNDQLAECASVVEQIEGHENIIRKIMREAQSKAVSFESIVVLVNSLNDQRKYQYDAYFKSLNI